MQTFVLTNAKHSLTFIFDIDSDNDTAFVSVADHPERKRQVSINDARKSYRNLVKTSGYVPYEKNTGIENGTYTVVNETGHVTLRIRESFLVARGERPTGHQQIEFLNGPDNTNDYKAFGFIENGKVRIWKKYRDDSNVAKAAQTLMTASVDDRETFGIEYAIRSSRCRRCNRVLTVPTSVHNGYGPECIKKV